MNYDKNYFSQKRSFPTFPLATVYVEPKSQEDSKILEADPDFYKDLKEFFAKMEKDNPGWGRKMSDIDGNTFLMIDAKFKINSIKSEGFMGCHTTGTSCVLSLYNMVQGISNLSKFNTRNALVSDDFRSLSDSEILKLPRDYNMALDIVKEELIGKTLRVVARSPEGSNRYGGCYYIFSIED